MATKRAVMPEQESEDARVAREGVEYGRTHGAAFAQKHAPDLTRLISTYADAEAQELLETLREEFWSTSVTP